jgi:hypothetical protein
MTLIWLTLAFVGGAVFWHKFGGWLLRRFGVKGMRADLLRNLDTDTLGKIHVESAQELKRRTTVIQEAGL